MGCSASVGLRTHESQKHQQQIDKEKQTKIPPVRRPSIKEQEELKEQQRLQREHSEKLEQKLLALQQQQKLEQQQKRLSKSQQNSLSSNSLKILQQQQLQIEEQQQQQKQLETIPEQEELHQPLQQQHEPLRQQQQQHEQQAPKQEQQSQQQSQPKVLTREYAHSERMPSLQRSGSGGNSSGASSGRYYVDGASSRKAIDIDDVKVVIRILRAEELPKTDACVDLDACVVIAGEVHEQKGTKVKNCCTNPEWNEDVVLDISTKNYPDCAEKLACLIFQLWDENANSYKLISTASFILEHSHFKQQVKKEFSVNFIKEKDGKEEGKLYFEIGSITYPPTTKT